jgi:hypothetical protein
VLTDCLRLCRDPSGKPARRTPIASSEGELVAREASPPSKSTTNTTVVDYLLPNTLKKLFYKKRLRSLADATSAIGVKVDSRLRVLLRLERNRLLKLLASSNAFATDTSDIFQQVDTEMVALTKRVAVAQRLDELRNRFDLGTASCPPAVSDKIDQHLQNSFAAVSVLRMLTKRIALLTRRLALCPYRRPE